MLTKIACWVLVVLAISLAVTGLSTILILPVWLNWRLRTGIPLLAGDYGHWLALFAAGVATASWAIRRAARAVAAVAIGVCALAFLLLLIPTIQAWRISRVLPAELSAAFGPAAPQADPISFSAFFPHGQKLTPAKTMEYSGSLKLDFYPASNKPFAPCVIDIHGGAWSAGNRGLNRAAHRSNSWLARSGYAVAAIDYRLAPAALWPAQRDDILAAIAFLRAHADELGIDPARIILLGRSAGGQLAEATAYAAHDPGICGVVELYGPADLTLAWTTASENDSFPTRDLLQTFLGGTPATARAAYDSASAVLLASADAPPTLLIHGQVDTLVPYVQSEVMAEKLAELGVPHFLLSIPWNPHGFGQADNTPGGQLTKYALQWFLEAVTRKKSP
jgi:acetyl esterase/lipase